MRNRKIFSEPHGQKRIIYKLEVWKWDEEDFISVVNWNEEALKALWTQQNWRADLDGVAFNRDRITETSEVRTLMAEIKHLN